MSRGAERLIRPIERAGRVQVLSMRNKANRLEELFITMVNGNGEKT